MNYPIPENCRFIAEVDERPVVDVRFEFNPERGRHNELHFNIKDGFDYQGVEGEGKLEAYGSQGNDDLLEVHFVRVFEYGNKRVNIGMTRSKARVVTDSHRDLVVRYQRVLAGKLLELQSKVFHYLKW